MNYCTPLSLVLCRRTKPLSSRLCRSQESFPAYVLQAQQQSSRNHTVHSAKLSHTEQPNQELAADTSFHTRSSDPCLVAMQTPCTLNNQYVSA